MWIARDKDNTLHLFLCKPTRINDKWYFNGDSIKLYGQIAYTYHYIKWEDEPIEVGLVKCKSDTINEKEE